MAAFLGGSRGLPARAGPVDVPVATADDGGDRSPTCSTRSSRRRAVKDIQSGIKDPDRFDQWIELLQERVAYDDPIVLPYGEGDEHRPPAAATASW